MTKHTGQGQIIKADVITQNEYGNWVPAEEEKYHPNLWESVMHFLRLYHPWTFTVEGKDGQIIIPDEPPVGAKCCMCGTIKKV